MRGWSRRLLPAAAGILALGLVLPAQGARAAVGKGLPAGLDMGDARIQPAAVAVAGTSAARTLGPLRRLLQADLLVVSPRALPAGLAARVGRLPGVVAAELVDAGRIRINGTFADMLGVDVSQFRAYAARPTASSAALWGKVAAGGMAVSFTMGKNDRLPLGRAVTVTGARTLKLPVVGFGTTGIAGVDAVVDRAVAASLGLPAGNALVISAPQASLGRLMTSVRKLLPAGAAVAALVTQVSVAGSTVTTGTAGGIGISAGQGLSQAQLAAFLAAAQSRVGMPYVWGAAGPRSFDCSGLVQWSMARAGIVMPRVAAEQARTGPLIPLSRLQPGDLLFYHADPTAPSYISHVAIYLGSGRMLQAPEPGLNVEIVQADFGAGFAGAVRVYPAVALAVAHSPAG